MLAHYSFDDGNLAATDVSGNGNNLSFPFSYNGGSANITSDALAGAAAVYFLNNGGSGGAYYYTQNSNLLSALGGSFSVSLWLKTTQVSGNNTDNGTFANAGIVSTFSETIVPMALTGSKLAFFTGGGTPDTLHSVNSVNSGQYVHVVVTRDQGTGQKKIYLNGALDASDTAGTGLLTNLTELDIGSQNGKGFNGEMDDIQIYSGVLSAAQVSQLHTNPGTTVGVSPPTPVNVSVSVTIQRNNVQSGGTPSYSAYAEIGSISPAPTATDRLVSSDGFISSTVNAGDTFQDNSTQESFTSLDQAIFACTNGQWSLYVNEGAPSQQVFYFKMAISGLTSNRVGLATILTPAPNAVNVASNSPLSWSGPTNASYLFVEAYQVTPSFVFDGYTNLAINLTNWPSPPALLTGTNYFIVEYGYFNLTNATFTMPADTNMNPVASFGSAFYLYTSTQSQFSVRNPLAVQINTPSQTSGGNFQLGFQTVAGHTETVQMRTNLLSGAWVDVTNFVGDGSSYQLLVPITNSPGKYFRVITQ